MIPGQVRLFEHFPVLFHSLTLLVVFGIDLEFLLEREGGGQVQPGAIPAVINKLILEVESRGLTEVGICK